MPKEELVQRLRQGDEEAFVAFVNEYKKKVVSLCYSYCKDSHEAEDLSQEAFIAFYKGMKNFRNESKISTFLYRITVNKCLSFKKKNAFTSLLGGFFINNKKENMCFEDKDSIRNCINTLSNELKTPLILYYHIGLSYKEIAIILEVSERAVEGKLYRAKQKLKTLLEKEENYHGLRIWFIRIIIKRK